MRGVALAMRRRRPNFFIVPLSEISTNEESLQAIFSREKILCKVLCEVLVQSFLVCHIFAEIAFERGKRIEILSPLIITSLYSRMILTFFWVFLIQAFGILTGIVLVIDGLLHLCLGARVYNTSPSGA